MVKISSQLYSVLFFVAISLLTIIIVQTFYSFLKSAIEFQLFLVSIIIELIFVFVIIKVYDELGSKWENVKTIPLITKKKAYFTSVQHNYYYNNNNDSKTIIYFIFGIPLSFSSSNLNQENNLRYCRNCGVLLTESILGGFQQKE